MCFECSLGLVLGHVVRSCPSRVCILATMVHRNWLTLAHCLMGPSVKMSCAEVGLLPSHLCCVLVYAVPLPDKHQKVFNIC